MTYPLVQAVTTPEPDADVVFDFNQTGSWYETTTLADGWTVGFPERLSVAGDVRTAWGLRRPAFAIKISGERQIALAAQSVLSRWLLQPEGWVKFQLDANSPVAWLRMLGATPGELEFHQIQVGGHGPDNWYLGVEFDAAPFFYGERVTALDGQSVTMHPGTGLVADLGAAYGDAPAPLRLSVNVGTNHGGDLWRTTTVPLPLAATGNGIIRRALGAVDDGMTYSPGGSPTDSAERVTVSGVPYWRFTNTGNQSYISGQVATTPAPGAYRAFLRVRTAATASVFRLGIATSINLFAGLGPTVTVDVPTTDTGTAWIDLGTHNLPARLPAGVPASKLTPATSSVYIFAERLSGTGSIDLGGIVLVPTRLVDAPAPVHTLLTEPRTAGFASGVSTAAVSLEWDGDEESMWAESTSTGALGRNAPSIAGGWPQIVPGTNNTLVLMRTPAPGETVTTDATSHSVQVTATYHPQWLYLPNHGNPL